MTKVRSKALTAEDFRSSRDALAFSSLFALLVILIFLAPAAAMEKRCAKAESVIGMEKSLPSLAQKIHSGEVIRIVALGSSSIRPRSISRASIRLIVDFYSSNTCPSWFAVIEPWLPISMIA